MYGEGGAERGLVPQNAPDGRGLICQCCGRGNWGRGEKWIHGEIQMVGGGEN